MGNARFLLTNLITSESMITVSSERAGQVGLAVKVGSGSATLSPAGPYTGATPRQYVVEVNDVSAGAGVGSAKYRWRPSDVSAWSATGVATSAAPAVLESGITVAWVSGGGTDFISGDYWTITVDKPFGKAKLLDRDRDTEWRSAGPTVYEYHLIDFGVSRQVDVCSFLDSNIPPSVTLYVMGSADPGFGSGLSEIFYPTGSSGVFYLTTVSRSYRYWMVRFILPANSLEYLSVGELFLGSYVEFSRNYAPQWTRGPAAATFGPVGALRTARGVWATAETISLGYRVMSEADRTKVLAMFDALYSPTLGTVRPLLVNLDSATPADISLYEMETPELPIASQFVGLYEWSLRLRQRPRLARSGS